MLEITTRQFRLEEDESNYDMKEFIKSLPGYMAGTLRYTGSNPTELTANFWVRVI